jgi:hypothetical protein
MNSKILLPAFTYLCFTLTGWTQQGNGNPDNNYAMPDTADIYVRDGEHTSFAYGRAIAFNKIAVGLVEDGVYELRGDTAVWLVDHPFQQDKPVCRIINDFATGNKLFVAPYERRMRRVDTVCVYNPGSYTICDKAGNVTGIIEPAGGRIVSPQGKTLLLNLHRVDKLLAAFFFAHEYTQVRIQLKFSAINNTINNFYNYRHDF